MRMGSSKKDSKKGDWKVIPREKLCLSYTFLEQGKSGEVLRSLYCTWMSLGERVLWTEGRWKESSSQPASPVGIGRPAWRWFLKWGSLFQNRRLSIFSRACRQTWISYFFQILEKINFMQNSVKLSQKEIQKQAFEWTTTDDTISQTFFGRIFDLCFPESPESWDVRPKITERWSMPF